MLYILSNKVKFEQSSTPKEACFSCNEGGWGRPNGLGETRDKCVLTLSIGWFLFPSRERRARVLSLCSVPRPRAAVCSCYHPRCPSGEGAFFRANVSFTAVGPGRPVEWVTSSPLSPTLRSLPPEGMSMPSPVGRHRLSSLFSVLSATRVSLF